MKRMLMIGIFWVFAMTACTLSVKNAEPIEPVETSSQNLVAIDSLMWQQPDSALTVLMDYLSDDKDAARHVSTDQTFDNHYAQLLASELLYKNDYAQTNRTELQQAVAYFDSLVREAGGFKTPRNRNDQLVFLAARAHYINGVGYYENDSVVEACTEYIKALEMMEGNFEEKELVGNKLRFMSYTYNRLGDLVYSQYMPESAIVCFKQALYYCKTEPTSKYAIPVLLYNIGIQFDISKQPDSADFYYNEALANIPDHDNFHYRDILASKALLAYNNGHCADSVITILKYVISLASNDDEKLTRLLTLGNILFEDMQYDSSKRYLKAVFEQQEDVPSKVTAAQNLCSIYKMENDTIVAQIYASYLAGFTMTEFEKKTDLSKTNEILQEYLERKQKKQAEDARQESIRKTIKIIIPIAVAFTLVIICMIKLRSTKLLNKQQEEADRVLGDKERSHQQEMELQRQNHKMQQAALSGRLKRSNEDLRKLKGQIKQQDSNVLQKAETQAATFADEPICRLIMERVNKGQFLSQMDYTIYRDYALDKNQLAAMRNTVDCHFNQFTMRISNAHPELTRNDLDYCCLYLLGLTDADIAALMQRAYNTVNERNSKLRRIFGSDSPISVTLQAIAKESIPA